MQGLSSPVILAIDADAVSLAAICGGLQASRYLVLPAADANAAWQLANANSLDLIISDVNLRGVDGLDLAERIRALPEQADVPVMFLTSAQVSDVAYRSVGQSSAYFVKKPFATELLVNLVEKSLWMPHLIQSRLHRPHLPIGSLPQIANGATTMESGAF